LCQRPRCWYFRNGYGLLALNARSQSLVRLGDNRFHAILGNAGPAYFVSPSTVAPPLIALDAEVHIAGPAGIRTLALEQFYVLPKSETEREHALRPNEIVVEVRIPPPAKADSAYYEVRQKHAFDWPLATATVILKRNEQKVEKARVVLSHVAPVPWRSEDAEAALAGQTVTLAVARTAAQAALQGAKSLGQNAYKIQIAKVALQRAILLAAQLDPFSS
jgi:xanthine dehydrogenase YagS FAD-binding subunit